MGGNTLEAYIDNESDFFKIAQFWVFLSDILNNELKKVLLKKGVKKTKISECLNLLITPPKFSYPQKERLEFLKIVSYIQSSSSLRKLFYYNSDFIRKNLSDYKKLDNFLKIHIQKFSWLSFGVFGPSLLNENSLIKKIKKSLRRPVRKQFKDYLGFSKEVRSKQKILKNRLRLTPEEWGFFRMMQQLSLLVDERKKIVFSSCIYLSYLLKELGKRLGVPKMYLYCLIHREIDNFLDSKKKNRLVRLLRERIRFSLVIGRNGEMQVLVREPALSYYLGKIKKTTKGKTKEERLIKGIVASPGTTKGKAKIVLSDKEIFKIKKNDILVTPMTTPEYASIFNKISAIITDEGGITCHAAIVSRELSLPCIIGTKVATQVLKDGNLIELDTNRGVVKIL